MPQNTEPDCYLANVGMPIYCSIVKRKTTLLFMFERASLYEACDVFVFMLDMPLCLFKLAVGSYVADVTSLI